MSCSSITRSGVTSARLPLIPLLALALGGFVTILTEALPAGLLPQISSGLNISEAMAGQLVTIYAIGSLLAAIPLTVMTQGMRRRPLLITAIAGFVVANTVTAFSDSYFLTMSARFVAGIAAGLLWALLPGYASRMVPESLQGRAIAIAMVGTPLALSLGVPAGTFLGNLVGWRMCFGIMSVMALLLVLWIYIRVPDFPGQKNSQRLPLHRVLGVAGVRPVLLAVLTFVLAHNILYTYIAPFINASGIGGQTDIALLLFGITSLLGIWVTGMFIDAHLRGLTLGSTVLFALSAAALGVASHIPAVTYASIAAWGLAFGGAATFFQTAMAKTAGDVADVAQSMVVTVWNTAIAGGGLIGGLLLNHMGVAAFPPALLILLAATFIIVFIARKHGFPPISRN